MKEQQGNLWHLWAQAGDNGIVCITTNGIVKGSGELVMGRGVALEAKTYIPNISRLLGSHVRANGNVPLFHRELSSPGWMSFPTKNHWKDPSSLELIRDSGIWLLGAAHLGPDLQFFLPHPGCGNGGRSWEGEVKPLLESLELPDNVIVVSR